MPKKIPGMPKRIIKRLGVGASGWDASKCRSWQIDEGQFYTRKNELLLYAQVMNWNETQLCTAIGNQHAVLTQELLNDA